MQALSIARTKRNISGRPFGGTAVTMVVLPTPSIIRLSSLSTVLLPLQRDGPCRTWDTIRSSTRSVVYTWPWSGIRATVDSYLWPPNFAPIRWFASSTVESHYRIVREREKKKMSRCFRSNIGDRRRLRSCIDIPQCYIDAAYVHRWIGNRDISFGARGSQECSEFVKLLDSYRRPLLAY